MENVIKALNYLLARFAEPSSHASLSVVFLLAGINVDSPTFHSILVVLGILSSTAGIFLPDQKK
jgi:hypothetical protein